jgi:selenocysteine lyase/cysteine desulfurase
VRAGLHCAPLIHEDIGAGQNGTVRVSFSVFNSIADIDALITALKEMVADR